MDNMSEEKISDMAGSFQDLFALYKELKDAGRALSDEEEVSLAALTQSCEVYFAKALVDAVCLPNMTRVRGVQLRVSDRDANQSLRRLLEHVSTAQMAEEGDANNYFLILENTIERAANQVRQLSGGIAALRTNGSNCERGRERRQRKRKAAFRARHLNRCRSLTS